MAQRTQVKEAVRRGPRESGYHMSLWTTKLVRHFIYTRFGIEYSRERVRQVLHALGFRLRRLRHRHLRAKPEAECRKFKRPFPPAACAPACGLAAGRTGGRGRRAGQPASAQGAVGPAAGHAGADAAGGVA